MKFVFFLLDIEADLLEFLEYHCNMLLVLLEILEKDQIILEISCPEKIEIVPQCVINIFFHSC